MVPKWDQRRGYRLSDRFGGGHLLWCLSRGSFRLEEVHGEEPPIACTPLFDKTDSLCKRTNPLLALMMWIKQGLCDAKNATFLQGLKDLSERCLTIGHLTKNGEEEG